jgi:hypothetical protein
MVGHCLQLFLSKTLHYSSDYGAGVFRHLLAKVSVIRHLKNIDENLTQHIILANALIDGRAHDFGLLPVSELHHLGDGGIGDHALPRDKRRIGHMLRKSNLIESLSKINLWLIDRKVKGSSAGK